MAECNELLTLLGKEDNYADLYVDLIKKSGDILDSYYWISRPEAASLDEPLKAIRETASSAIDEFEKVRAIKEHTAKQMAEAQSVTDELLAAIRRKKPNAIMEFVGYLGDLRGARGKVLGLKELKYSDEELIGSLETTIIEKNEELGQQTVTFLLSEEALTPYQEKVSALGESISSVTKVSDANEIRENIDGTADQLELLIDVVGNLSIEDATQTTAIIERVSEIFSRLNGLRSGLKNRRKELLGTEAKAEFVAQLNLLEQSVVNYLDLSDSAQKAEDNLTRLMVQVEELEGRFAEFDEYTATLAEKREEIYNAFETKRLQLLEARTRRASGLFDAAERILKGIRSKSNRFEEADEINSYFASDLMVSKVRDMIGQLTELEDPVKAGDLETRLKTLKEDAIRQLKDRKELFADGDHVIRLGRHAFSVNRQKPDLTIVPRGREMYVHVTGTDYFQPIQSAEFEETRSVWDQTLISESPQVYRGEFLAWKFLEEQGESASGLQDLQTFMSDRYLEGYTKGVHDLDAWKIYESLRDLRQQLGTLRYAPEARALAALCWLGIWEEPQVNLFLDHIRSRQAILNTFGAGIGYGEIEDQIADRILADLPETPESIARQAAAYLCEEMGTENSFAVANASVSVVKEMKKFLKKQKKEKVFQESLAALSDAHSKFLLIRQWVEAYLRQVGHENQNLVPEATICLFAGEIAVTSQEVGASVQLEGLLGDHPIVENGGYLLDYYQLEEKLTQHEDEVVPRFEQMTRMKHELIESERQTIRLEEFQPKVMTSFVRNQLIDKLYLPIIGDNLAKQLGTVGENTRTDRQGMLLLISPPGYGKTTLMEYIANRLGLVFMKINGPAIGHQVTSLDPSEAPNAGAREELYKLNLALEMGDNIMLYLDDIQHCHPEFLQKFISLTDAQRKIEGVFRRQSKTYDLRGKKVAVVMAGNPYTESGEKFRIPDMLSNRADTYNLGDMIGGSEDLFRLSYLENAVSANPVVARLGNLSSEDQQAIFQTVERGVEEYPELSSNLSVEELKDIFAILGHMKKIRDVVLQVNQAYIKSAGQQDEYRKEPPFLLQGSYRNMARMTEKLAPIMNEDELTTLIQSHYESESQTLTTSAEANFLRFREMTGKASEEELARKQEINQIYLDQKRVSADRLSQIVAEMRSFSEGLLAIRDVISPGKDDEKEGE